MIHKATWLFITVNISLLAIAQTNPTNQWNISSEGGIIRTISAPGCAYEDNIEMSGRRISAIVDYAIDTLGNIKINRKLIWPQLRSLPNSNSPWWQIYRAYTIKEFDDYIAPLVYYEDTLQILPPVKSIRLNGFIEIIHQPLKNGLLIKRHLYPSMNDAFFEEQWHFINSTNEAITIDIAAPSNTIIEKGVNDFYEIKQNWSKTGTQTIQAEETHIATGSICAFEKSKPIISDGSHFKERQAFLQTMDDNLILETPNETINQLFHFSKIRGAESIFDTKLGLVHSPGGGRYYGGFWANDQAEYIGPFFPYLNYPLANEAALNMYRLYLKEINNDYKNIRYSFEMEGDAPINPLDRGDAAMISYGTLQYVLALSDKKVAEELKQLIDWCLEYCHRQLNEEGVVESESDEMEGRIETGSANLSTSTLYYGALELYEGFLQSLDRPQNEIDTFNQRKKSLGIAIENYFGSEISGIQTYKYFKEHTQLRHWICLPLVVGINNRKEGTIDALFNYLWSENGVHVEKNSDNPEVSKIFWDRATLYALRGTFLAGETEKSFEKLKAFSKERLLGKRVPYVVEAYPEGNMAHLSAESGLYCRVITEGMFGIKSTGFNKFTVNPQLPKSWNYMRLKKVAAFGGDIDIEVTRKQEILELSVAQKGNILVRKIIKNGETTEVKVN